jgi:hypothetical protein
MVEYTAAPGALKPLYIVKPESPFLVNLKLSLVATLTSSPL